MVVNMVNLIDNRNADVSLANIFLNELIPLYQEYWGLISNEPFDLQLQALINMWLGGAIKIFTLSDNNTIVGFAICLIYRPLTYNSVVLQIKDIYCRASHAYMYQELVDYIKDSTKFLGCNEIHSSQPLKLDGWEEQPDIISKRYKLNGRG